MYIPISKLSVTWQTTKRTKLVAAKKSPVFRVIVTISVAKQTIGALRPAYYLKQCTQ